MEYYRTMVSNRPGISGIPPDAILVDLGSGREGPALPDAQKVDPSRLKEFILRTGKEKTYLLFCRKGLQSAHWSGLLRSEGINAFYTTESELLKNRPGKEASN
jgi:hypothetical protein